MRYRSLSCKEFTRDAIRASRARTGRPVTFGSFTNFSPPLPVTFRSVEKLQSSLAIKFFYVFFLTLFPFFRKLRSFSPGFFFFKPRLIFFNPGSSPQGFFTSHVFATPLKQITRKHTCSLRIRSGPVKGHHFICAPKRKNRFFEKGRIRPH